MKSEDIYKNCKCCSCGGPLPKIPIMVQLPVKAAWKFPVWGNIITGASDLASAFICDGCNDIPIAITDVKNAIEFRGDNVDYHTLQWDGEACSLKPGDSPSKV